MKRTRILHLRASNFVGGPERQILRYAEYERDGECEPILGSFVGEKEGREFLAEAQRRGFCTVELPGDSGDLRAVRVLQEALRREEISLLCTHGYKADILGILAARRQKIPAACFLRGFTAEDWKVRAYERLDRAFLRLASRVVCLSETQARRVGAKAALRDRVRVVANAIEMPAIEEADRREACRGLRERLGLAPDSTVVACAGRLSPEKGAIHFLEAAAMVRKDCPGGTFVVFGDGPLRASLEARAAALGLQQAVLFAGFVPDFHRLLPGVDVFVNPSLSEEMPNVVLEAMAAGVPLVATEVGAVAEIAGGRDTVALVPPSDPQLLAEAIVELLKNPARARQMAEAAGRRVAQAYSPAAQKAQLRALYQEMIPGLSFVAETAAIANRATEWPLVSVVLPVRNEGRHIGAVLDDLLAQDYPRDRFEILVADGNSTDATAEVVQEYAKTSPVRVTLLPNPAGLSSAGRNVGARARRGQFVLFVDGHCRIPSRSLLRDTARLFEETGADCLCRPQPLDASENTWFQRVIADARASLIGHGRDSTIYDTSGDRFVEPMSSGACYRADVFEKIGYYDERFDACEDVEFNYRVHRAGLRSYWSARLAVQYSPRTRLSGLWKQMVRYGRGRFRFARKHPQALTLAQLVPAGLVAWVIGGAVTSFGWPLLASVYAGSLAAYAAVVLVSSAALALRRGWKHVLAAPFVYLTIHGGLGAGYWAEWLDTLLGRKRLPESGVEPKIVEGQGHSSAIPREYEDSEVRTPGLKG